MTQFQPSDISRKIDETDLGTWYDPRTWWGADTSSSTSGSGTMTEEERAWMTEGSVEVNDGGGSIWAVYSDGSTRMVSTSVASYKSLVGVKKSPAASKGIIANLRAVSGNAAKIDVITGPLQLPAPHFETAAQKGTGGGASGAGPAPGGGGEPGITDNWWFWPAVVATGTTVLAGGAFYYLRYTQAGQQQYAKLVTANPNVIDAEEIEGIEFPVAKKNSGTAIALGVTALVGVLGIGGFLWWKTKSGEGRKRGKGRGKGKNMSTEQAADAIFEWASAQPWAAEGGVSLSQPEQDAEGDWSATVQVGGNVGYAVLHPDGSIDFSPGA